MSRCKIKYTETFVVEKEVIVNLKECEDEIHWLDLKEVLQDVVDDLGDDVENTGDGFFELLDSGNIIPEDKGTIVSTKSFVVINDVDNIE